jgi:hypothetical protein
LYNFYSGDEEGFKILHKKIKVSYVAEDEFNIVKTKDINFSEAELEHKTIFLEDYFKIKGGLHTVVMNGKTGWRIEPRVKLSRQKFFFYKRLKIMYMSGYIFTIYSGEYNYIGIEKSIHKLEVEEDGDETIESLKMIGKPFKEVYAMDIHHTCKEEYTTEKKDCFTVALIGINKDNYTELRLYSINLDLENNKIEMITILGNSLFLTRVNQTPEFAKIKFLFGVNFFRKKQNLNPKYPVVIYGLSLFQELILGSVTFKNGIEKDSGWLYKHDNFILDGRNFGTANFEFKNFELLYNPILLFYTPLDSNLQVNKENYGNVGSLDSTEMSLQQSNLYMDFNDLVYV